jgi:N-acetylneuraminic acid mutarotase
MSKWKMLRPMSIERSHCGTATADGKIFVFGGGGIGFKSLQGAEFYDPSADLWRETAPMPTLRSGLVAVSLNNLTYVMGGGFKNPDGSFNFLTVVEIFNPSDHSWQKGPSLRMRHDAPAAVLHEKEIYLFAGHHPDVTGGPLTDPAFPYSERLDPKKEIWEEIDPLPTPRFSPAATIVDDQIWVMGGGAFKDNRFQNFDLIEIYDPKSKKWMMSHRQRLPWPSAGLSACNLKNSVYIFGGNDGNGISNRAAVYDSAVGKWDELEPMPEPRAAASAVAIENVIYLVGGRDASGKTPTRTLMAFFPD